MAKNFCVPKDLVPQLQRAVAKLADNGQINALTAMSTEDRVAFFNKTLKNNDEATQLNKRFETAVGQKRLDSLRNWVKNNLDPKYRQDEAVFNMKQYKNLQEVDNYISSRMELLAEQKMGIALTDEQVEKMTELGNKFFSESKKLGDNLGKLGFEEENIAWGKAYRELTDYRDNLMPTNWWKAMVNNLGRATMLASIKTPLLNIESNAINAITEAITRRFSIGTAFKNTGVKAAAKDYQKFARKMFKETGVDFTRMIDLDDTIAGMGRIVGEETQRIPNAMLRAYTDFVFEKTLSRPDVFFASGAFTDSLALRATKASGNNSEQAAKLFKDATNVNATGEAKVLRDAAIADARYATYTNDSISSKISEDMRTVLNKAGGLGDLLMPFVKTPANVAELAVEYAGFGFVKGTFVVGKSMIKDGQISKEAMQTAMRGIARSGVGMTAGYMLASNYNQDHFIGVYDPKRRTIDALANTNYNAVLIGDRWVSVDYLGPLAAPFVSFMYAKKYGSANYISGATSSYLSQLPFIDAKSVFDGIDMLMDPSNSSKMVKLGEDLVGNLGQTAASRLVPGIMYDIARAFDDVQRDTKQSQFVVQTPIYDFNFDSFINKIPFLRTNLPIKHDALGRVMLETTPIESMLFGARVRDAASDKITLEILRLRNTGNTPKVKDLRFMNSTKVDRLKEKLGDDNFYEVVNDYGDSVAKKYQQEMRKSSYRRLSDEAKEERLSEISNDEYDRLMRRYNI